MKLRIAMFFLTVFFAGSTLPAAAQQFDPRPSLGALITAFQRCAPSPVYQMLSPYLFDVVAQQTGGSGCYPGIAAAGPITAMAIIDGRQFPVGPLFVIRVNHTSSPPADWFIGFDQISGKIIYLSYQAVGGGGAPDIDRGPEASKNLGGIKPPDDDDIGSDDDDGDSKKKPASSCIKFPQMCP